MPSIFTRIINGQIPCHKIYEDEKFIAFLDIRPLAEGHTLVVPKQEIDYIFDHDDQTLAEMMIFAKKVARAIEKAIPCLRIGLAVVGLEVPHTHLHLIPLHQPYIDFRNPIHQTQEELAATAKKIIAHL
ncbi:MAG: HIT family protein [Cytophagales bacterium]|nr:HIT family protein [Bernardetiaceae bacterium]MDW8210916.1 HIT family protein [Cytophagales bacterium]